MTAWHCPQRRPPSEMAAWYCLQLPPPAKRLPGIAPSATVSSRHCRWQGRSPGETVGM